jgi:hypothetical protein
MCDNINEDTKINNISVIKKNQSVNFIMSNNRHSSSKGKMNKVNINDNPNEESDRNKNMGDKIIQRFRGSPNHKRVDIVQKNNNNNNYISNNNKNTQNNIININVKLSQDLANSNHNILNKSQNGKELKDSKIIENKPLNRSVNITYNLNNLNEKDKRLNSNNSSNSNINSTNISNNSVSVSNNKPSINISNNNNSKIINNIYKSTNSNSIGVIVQEDNEDENSIDNNKKEEKVKENNQAKNKIVENRYSTFVENNQIINENNIYIHDKKDDKS